MQNKLSDLNNYMFEQMERLNDTESLKERNNLEFEMERTRGLCVIAKNIVEIAKTQLEAIQVCNDLGIETKQQLPPMLDYDETEDRR